ncbi:hypothetical protein [Rhodanobacter lindaniclasticus]
MNARMPADELTALNDLIREMPISQALETICELRSLLVERVQEADRAIEELRRRARGGA